MTLKPPDGASLPVNDRTDALFLSPINVEYPEYGASVGGTSNRAALQSAFDAAATGAEVYFPRPTPAYPLTGPVTYDPRVRVRGPGAPLAQKTHRNTFGTYDQAAVVSFIANRSSRPTTQVLGTTDPSTANERSSVTVYADNTAKQPAVDSTSTAFTSSTVTFGGGVDLSAVVPGMIVDAGGAEHVGGATTGVVQSVSGQVVTLANGWRSAGNLTSTPSAATRVRINRVNKIWGANFNVRSTTAENSPLAGVSMAGIEVGIETDFDYASLGFSGANTGQHSFAYDAYNNTAYTGRPLIGYAVRGAFLYGFASSGPYGASGTSGAHFVAHRNYEITPNSLAEAAFMDQDANVVYAFKASKSPSYSGVLAAKRDTDTTNRFQVDRDGKHEWGAAVSAAVDTVVQRSAGGVLSIGSAADTLEVGFASGVALVQGFDRGSSTYKPLWVDGSATTLRVGGTTRIGLDTNGIGFFGATPAGKPSVAGSRGANAALASLLTALATLGLVTDGTTV